MSGCCPHAWDREIVTAQGSATGSAVSGTDMRPATVFCKSITTLEAPPPETTLEADPRSFVERMSIMPIGFNA